MSAIVISAALVKELRERTSAGMMECKKALQESAGDLAAAEVWLAKYGVRKVQKAASRVAAEGLITSVVSADGQHGLILEVNCETDFVARDASFVAFVQLCAQSALAVLEQGGLLPDNLDQLMVQGQTVEELRHALIARLGENIQVRRHIAVQARPGARLADYVHGGRIGVLVELQSKEAALAKDLAMHVAASAPLVVDPSQVPADRLAIERDIVMTQAAEQGKPPAIAEKMVEGRLAKYRNECALLGQAFIKNPDKTVEQVLQEHQAQVYTFVRYSVGEGIEKQSSDFAKEVMEQVRDNQ